MTDEAPTTSGIPDLSVAAGTVDQVLALTDFFADSQTPPEDMVYSIVQNSNASLFNSLAIDSSGNLTLTFANNTTGDATLTIRATDAAGLLVDTTLAVHVSDAPVISNFYCINEFGDYWTLTGTVTDNDDPVVGDVVTFGGVLASYNLSTTVGTDGVFSLTVELAGLQEGYGHGTDHRPARRPFQRGMGLDHRVNRSMRRVVCGKAEGNVGDVKPRPVAAPWGVTIGCGFPLVRQGQI